MDASLSPFGHLVCSGWICKDRDVTSTPECDMVVYVGMALLLCQDKSSGGSLGGLEAFLYRTSR